VPGLWGMLTTGFTGRRKVVRLGGSGRLPKHDAMNHGPNDGVRDAVGGKRSVSALLSSVIDYAGLFAPAELDMATTVRNYATYLAGADEWMLNRLIVPVSRLGEFEEEAEGLLPRGEEDEPWLISALTAPAGEAGVEAADVARIEAFNDAHGLPAGGLAMVDVIEMQAESADAIDAALDAMPDDLFPFFELPVGRDPRGLIAALVGGEAGAEIRMSGETADLYPTAEQVARFLSACVSADVPFKLAAGLHQPLTHEVQAAGAKEFGYLNVLVAAVLALHRKLPEDEVIAILGEESIAAFSFNDDGLAWRHERVDINQIEDARLTLAISFVSSSLDEPREDLRVLGLL